MTSSPLSLLTVRHPVTPESRRLHRAASSLGMVVDEIIDAKRARIEEGVNSHDLLGLLLSVRSEATRPPEKFSYLPFSAGPRGCIGEMFAMTEIVLVLATILQRYRLRLKSGHSVEPLPLITLRPAKGMPMSATRIQ